MYNRASLPLYFLVTLLLFIPSVSWNGSFNVNSFNIHYLSIPEYPFKFITGIVFMKSVVSIDIVIYQYVLAFYWLDRLSCFVEKRQSGSIFYSGKMPFFKPGLYQVTVNLRSVLWRSLLFWNNSLYEKENPTRLARSNLARQQLVDIFGLFLKYQ